MQYKDEILSAIPSLLNKKQIFYFIDFIIIAILFWTKSFRLENKKDFKPVPVVAMLVCIIFFCTSYHFIPESLELVNGYIYSKKNSVRYGTIYGYHFVDLKNAVTNRKNAAYETYDEMMDTYKDLKGMQETYAQTAGSYTGITNGEEVATIQLSEPMQEYDEMMDVYENLKDMQETYTNPQNSDIYTGIAESKNVIVVQLESVQEFVIDREINGKEITPNLNQFLHENINITNMHASSYTTTADSEHSFISGIYPGENGEAFSKYYSNTYDDIFGNFKEAGYTNIYAHGNYGTFWNRKNVLSKYEVDQPFFIDDFPDASELIQTYLSDELLYTQIFDMIEETQTPIFVDLVAASSHKPFKLEGIQNKEQKVSIDVGKYAETDFGNYLEAMNYADYAFGIFLQELKERGLYDDSVILVYGDHYGMTMYDENLIEFLGENNENYNDIRMQYEFSNVACGMRIPGIQNIVIDYPVSKIDLKPTLMQICKIEDTFSLGTSIFHQKPYVCINNGKIITEQYYYDGEKWYELATGKEVDEQSLSEEKQNELKRDVEYMEKELGISMSILTNNLLKVD